MPGPWSRTVSSPSRTVTSISPPAGLHLAALSSRFETARSTVAGTPRTSDGSSVGREGDAGAVAPGPLDRVGGDEVEPDVLGLARRLVAAGELDELGDQRRHLGQLLGDVAQQLLAVAGRQRLVAGEHLDVRAQARQRRPQLVRRVGDELALRARRVLERAEHRVERRRQARELVVAGRVDAAREVARLGHLLGRPGQPLDGCEHRLRDDEAEAAARAMPRPRSGTAAP